MLKVSLILRTAVASAAAAALLAWPGSAAGFETIIQDDARTLQGSTETTRQTFEQMARLGVDRVRITVGWAQVAPSPHSQKRPRGFNAADPMAYGPRSRYFNSPIVLVDRAVIVADYLGMKVDLVLGLGAPRWAAAGSGSGQRVGAVVRPNAREFAAFARAMAARYSGNSLTPIFNVRIPRVDMFEIWNEPNVPAFAQPQFAGGQAVAADWYRGLVQAAHPAIKSANRGATVLIGSTAAAGSRKGGSGTPVGPLAFVRRLACVDLRLRPVRTGGCRRFRRVPGDGFSHHPYVLKGRPNTAGTNPEDVRIASLGRLTSLLGRLGSRGRVSRGVSNNMWLTEFGYETNDPVRTKPWSLTQQARFLAAAEYLAQRNSRVRSFSQFLLRDIGTGAALRAAQRGQPGRVFGSWQTGLFFEDGRPKPSADSFRLTLLPFRSGRDVVSFYGNVRPARSPVTARIEQQLGDGSWQPIASSPAGGGAGEQQFSTGGEGTFLRRLSAPGLADASFRVVWVKPDGSTEAGPPQSIAAL